MEERKNPVQKGEVAPDFTLKDQNGKEFKLSEQSGKRILLSFHPLLQTYLTKDLVCVQGPHANKGDFLHIESAH